jgi:hypothetical protein
MEIDFDDNCYSNPITGCWRNFPTLCNFSGKRDSGIVIPRIQNPNRIKTSFGLGGQFQSCYAFESYSLRLVLRKQLRGLNAILSHAVNLLAPRREERQEQQQYEQCFRADHKLNDAKAELIFLNLMARWRGQLF